MFSFVFFTEQRWLSNPQGGRQPPWALPKPMLTKKLQGVKYVYDCEYIAHTGKKVTFIVHTRDGQRMDRKKSSCKISSIINIEITESNYLLIKDKEGEIKMYQQLLHSTKNTFLTDIYEEKLKKCLQELKYLHNFVS